MTMQELILEETKYEGFRAGIRQGIKETKEAIVSRMIEMQILSDEQIIKIAKVTPSFLGRIRKKLTKAIEQVH